MAKKDHHQKHDGMRQILSELSLTIIQKQDIRQILKQTSDDRDLFSTDAKSLKTELRNLVQSTAWDQTAVEGAISQHQDLMQTRALQRASNKNQVWNLLTDEQQAEFVVLFDRLKTQREEMGSEGKIKGKGKTKGERNKLKRLDLTEEQLAGVEVIKTAAKASGEETKAKLKTYKQAERALVHSTDFNAEAWQTLSNEYQADFMTMVILRAKTKHDIWNLLTPEQQTEADEKAKGKKSQHRKSV
jgi:Spy/CpxP family protein refolding chaperone